MKHITYSLQLVRILLHRLRVQHLSVVLAHIKILVLVLRQSDLLLVVSELEVGDVVFGLDWRIVGTSILFLLFPFLLLLLQLFGCLLRLACEIPGADLSG